MGKRERVSDLKRRRAPKKTLTTTLRQIDNQKGLRLFEKLCDLFEETLLSKTFEVSETAVVRLSKIDKKKWRDVEINATYDDLLRLLNGIWVEFAQKKGANVYAFLRIYHPELINTKENNKRLTRVPIKYRIKSWASKSKEKVKDYATTAGSRVWDFFRHGRLKKSQKSSPSEPKNIRSGMKMEK